MRTESGTRVSLHEPFVQHDVLSRESERSPSGHRVTGIDGKVGDHLLELTGIGADERILARPNREQLDVLADQSTQQSVDVRHDVIEVEHARLQHLPADERQ